jgi:uncharacterized coiled-coil protein SlyX
MPDGTPQNLLSRHLMAIAEHLEGLSTRVAKLETEIMGQDEKMQRYLDRFLDQVGSAVRDLEQASEGNSKRLVDLEGKITGQQATITRLGSLDEKMGLLNVKIDEDLASIKKELEFLKKWVDNELRLDETLLRRLEAVPKQPPHLEPKQTSQAR